MEITFQVQSTMGATSTLLLQFTILHDNWQSLDLCISPSIDALPPASRLHFPNDVSLTSTRNTKPRTTVGTFVIPQVTSSQVHSIYANCPASVFSAEYSNIQVPVLIRQWTRARRGARHKTRHSNHNFPIFYQLDKTRTHRQVIDIKSIYHLWDESIGLSLWFYVILKFLWS